MNITLQSNAHRQGRSGRQDEEDEKVVVRSKKTKEISLYIKLQQWKKNRKYCGKKVMAWFWLQYKNSSIAALIEGELNGT